MNPEERASVRAMRALLRQPDRGGGAKAALPPPILRSAVLGVVAGSALAITNLTGLVPERGDDTRLKTEPAPLARTADQGEGPTVVYSGTSEDGLRSELDTILDSMLITKGVPPGTAFEDRIGEVDDERVLALMREIDDSLGGRIAWPNVKLVDGLMDTPTPEGNYIRGQYSPRSNTIVLDKGLVEHELDTHLTHDRSVRSLLVHELQHATTAANWRQLLEQAETNDWPYEDGSPYAESRADLASLLDAELAQRHGAGPRLNELDPADRRDALSEILTEFLHRRDDRPHDYARGTLLYALKDDHYVHSRGNAIWNMVRTEHLDDFTMGRLGYNKYMPPGMTEDERDAERYKPLTRVAEDWRDRAPTARQPHHDERPATSAEAPGSERPAEATGRPALLPPGTGLQSGNVDEPVERPGAAKYLEHLTTRRAEPRGARTTSRTDPMAR